MPKMQADANVIKVDKRLGLVFGYAIVCCIDGKEYFDTQGDHIPEASMLKAATEFMLSSREAKEMHVGEKKGTIVFAFPLTSDIAMSMGITASRTGLIIGMKPDDPEIVERFATGEYTGFSIGGSRVTDKIIDEDTY